MSLASEIRECLAAELVEAKHATSGRITTGYAAGVKQGRRLATENLAIAVTLIINEYEKGADDATSSD